MLLFDIVFHERLNNQLSFLSKADAAQHKILSCLITDAQILRERLPALGALSALLNTTATTLHELQERTKSLHDAMTAAQDAGWTSKDCLEVDIAVNEIGKMKNQIQVLEVGFKMTCKPRLWCFNFVTIIRYPFDSAKRVLMCHLPVTVLSFTVILQIGAVHVHF